MKLFYFSVCILLIFILEFTVGDDCSQEDRNLIEKCYEKYIFTSLSRGNSRNRFVQLYDFAFIYIFGDQKVFKKACARKSLLDECLDKSLVKRCFNDDNLQKLSFYKDTLENHPTSHGPDFFAHAIKMTYFSMDYLCGDMYQYALVNIDLIHANPSDNCSREGHMCDTIQNITNCMSDQITDKNGPDVGEFFKKSIIYQMCCYLPKCKTCVNLAEESLASLPDTSGSCKITFFLSLFTTFIFWFLLRFD